MMGEAPTNLVEIGVSEAQMGWKRGRRVCTQTRCVGLVNGQASSELVKIDATEEQPGCNHAHPNMFSGIPYMAGERQPGGDRCG